MNTSRPVLTDDKIYKYKKQFTLKSQIYSKNFRNSFYLQHTNNLYNYNIIANNK